MLSALTGLIPTEAIIGILGFIGVGFASFFGKRSGRKAAKKDFDIQDKDKALQIRKEAAEVQQSHEAEVKRLTDEALEARLEASRAKKKPTTRRKPARK